MATKQQFDPVAAAAVSAINASQRSLTTLQQDLGAPELPSQAQAARTATQGVEQVSQVSPFNVLVKSDLPNLPGMQGQFQLPGMQGQGLPNPQDLLPSAAGSGLPDPQQVVTQAQQNLPFLGANSPLPRPSPPASGNGQQKNQSNKSANGSGSRDARAARERYSRNQ